MTKQAAVAIGLWAVLAGAAGHQSLLLIFGIGLTIVSAQMGLGDARWRLASQLPDGALRAAIASIIGALSAMMGIGGGAFGVTVMTLCGRPIHQAVATASGFGAAIALPAMLGFIAMGWGREGLPWGSLGYVNVVGFVALALLTTLTAPMGARLAHRLDQKVLKRAFALFLLVTAANMLREAFS